MLTSGKRLWKHTIKVQFHIKISLGNAKRWLYNIRIGMTIKTLLINSQSGENLHTRVPKMKRIRRKVPKHNKKQHTRLK